MKAAPAEQEQLSVRRRSRKQRKLGPTTRKIAELYIAGLEPARIAEFLGINKSVVSRHLKRIADRGGITECYPDLWNPFSAPMVRELFNACKARRRPLKAASANKVMAGVQIQPATGDTRSCSPQQVL